MSRSTLMVMFMTLVRALLPVTSKSRGKLSSGNLEDLYSLWGMPVQSLLAGHLSRGNNYSSETCESFGGPVILMEPLEGSSTCPALQGRHFPPGGRGLAFVVTNQWISGATWGGQEVLGPHGNVSEDLS